MNKQKLIEVMASQQKDTKAAAERWLNTWIGCVKKGLKKDQQVQLVGFGSFNVKNRKARTGRNPQTGKTIQIKASRTVKFKPSQELKTWV